MCLIYVTDVSHTGLYTGADGGDVALVGVGGLLGRLPWGLQVLRLLREREIFVIGSVVGGLLGLFRGAYRCYACRPYAPAITMQIRQDRHNI